MILMVAGFAWKNYIYTRPNCALDGRTMLCLYVPGFHRQGLKRVQVSSQRSKKMREQKKNKASVLVSESAYNSQNSQFGLRMKNKKNQKKTESLKQEHLQKI